MYYYLPKAAERPVYSYRLSVVHFWSLVFIYIWAGPHHLLNTALPEWLQSLGMIFSLMLWAPSWGGMLNGLLTLRGAWHKLRTDPVLKFFAAGVTFYGMATFEGPLLAIRSINAISHYTDWTIGHVHSGTLGWNSFMAAGMFYWLAPRLWNTKLYSVRLADIHFWLGMVGILLYIAAMRVSGITQGLMLNAVTSEGVLAYPNFLEVVNSVRPMQHMRVLGGGLFLLGSLAADRLDHLCVIYFPVELVEFFVVDSWQPRAPAIVQPLVVLTSSLTGSAAEHAARIRAGELVGNVASQVGGRGGGRPDFAQAGGTNAVALAGALASVVPFVQAKLGG
jgi:cbb3-type cytochrome oxidase subunit 1